MGKARRRAPSLRRERELEALYAKIPAIPDCSGACADACGPIAMFKGEWDRVVRTHGSKPRLAPGSIVCPLLSPTGKCTVYTMRPFICRLWGTTPTLACPQGCQPERWLSIPEARELFEAVAAIAGPEIRGTMGGVEDLWEGFALEARATRQEMMQQIEEAFRGSQA